MMLLNKGTLAALVGRDKLQTTTRTSVMMNHAKRNLLVPAADNSDCLILTFQHFKFCKYFRVDFCLSDFELVTAERRKSSSVNNSYI